MINQEQIKKMLSKLKSGYFCQPDCYGCCGDSYLDITCNIVVDNFIKELHNAGYRKVSADTLILTENQLKKIIGEEYKNALKGKVVLTTEEYQDLVVKSMDNFSSAMVEARKETAKEIMLLLGKGYDETKRTDFKDLEWYKAFCRELNIRYGIEVEQ